MDVKTEKNIKTTNRTSTSLSSTSTTEMRLSLVMPNRSVSESDNGRPLASRFVYLQRPFGRWCATISSWQCASPVAEAWSTDTGPTTDGRGHFAVPHGHAERPSVCLGGHVRRHAARQQESDDGAGPPIQRKPVTEGGIVRCRLTVAATRVHFYASSASTTCSLPSRAAAGSTYASRNSKM